MTTHELSKEKYIQKCLKDGGQIMGVPLKFSPENEQRLYLVLGGESAELML